MNCGFSSVFAALGIFLTTNCCTVIANDIVKIGGRNHPEQHIKLMHFDPSRLQAHKPEFFLKSEKDYTKGIMPFSKSPGAVDLGMNNVPVLNQGEEGTCVTFSSTAALDALLAKGDFISQQCSLALDANMGDNYWNGANYPSQVIQPLQAYGVVQQEKCPFKYPNVNETINIPAYQLLSDLPASQFVRKVTYYYSPTPQLNNLKSALKQGYRVLMAFSINDINQEAVQGFDMNVGGLPTEGGLWACRQPQSQNYCANSLAGHEVLVIGYDDKQELLKIRNSWSDKFGDQGNYYMTYTFFNAMAVDQTVIY